MTSIICDRCKRRCRGKSYKVTSLLLPTIYFDVVGVGVKDICEGCVKKLIDHIKDFL